ncbi:jmjC domain-containing protein 8-like [Tubulanus polymorphus]|uniref:jmjC domain-containing protein 8-like n=1 Tax=Tubulanus polymorphus TaxID=672921 RepID=UPI003DA36986
MDLLLRLPVFGILVILRTSIADHFHDDGGWHTDRNGQIAEEGPCHIEVRGKDLTNQEFLNRYAFTKPVVLKDFSNNKNFLQLTRRKHLLENYGHKKIKLSTANTHSYDKQTVSLKTYVNDYLKPQSLDALGNETLYWFGDNDFEDWSGFFERYNRPALYIPRLTGALSYGIAGPGTGVPFHWHGAGFAEVLYGRKRWFMYPPHKTPSFHPNQTTLHWLIYDYPTLSYTQKPLECTIGPGEIIFFPDQWWHATLNIDTSVFISTFLG